MVTVLTISSFRTVCFELPINVLFLKNSTFSLETQSTNAFKITNSGLPGET